MSTEVWGTATSFDASSRMVVLRTPGCHFPFRISKAGNVLSMDDEVLAQKSELLIERAGNQSPFSRGLMVGDKLLRISNEVQPAFLARPPASVSHPFLQATQLGPPEGTDTAIRVGIFTRRW